MFKAWVQGHKSMQCIMDAMDFDDVAGFGKLSSVGFSLIPQRIKFRRNNQCLWLVT